MTQDSRETLPFLALRRGVLLPGGSATLPMSSARAKAQADALSPGARVAIGIPFERDIEEPQIADLHPVVVVGEVEKIERRGDDRRLVVRLDSRATIHGIFQRDGLWEAEIAEGQDASEPSDEADVLAASLVDHLRELGAGRALDAILVDDPSPGAVADRIAQMIETPDDAKIEILRETEAAPRLRRVLDLLKRARAIASLKEKVDAEVRERIGSHQRELIVREQIRALQKELGDGDPTDPIAKLRSRLEALELPEEVREVVDRELGRLGTLGSGQPDAHVVRNYLELIADLPWNERAEVSGGIDAVAEALEQDHHGLDDVKRRILEHLAVLKLTGESRGTILALAGPPGVGKTSLARSIAAATGRPLARVSLGGVRDEAEIRGHRRTYVGALPGRILSALRKARVKNPVVVLDEIDKLGRGWAGDPEAALLEVLDPEQNSKFTDHYLELPFDLSEVLFIATANDLSTISPPLRDRLEIIDVSGYSLDEKTVIAEKHLLPSELSRHGLDPAKLSISEDDMVTIVREYTREAGVRQLRRQLAKICRRVALGVARGSERDVAASRNEGSTERDSSARVLTLREIREALGRPRYLSDVQERVVQPGVAAGLAWTPTGGDVLYVESTKMRGSGKLEITGQLGDVMNESARAALAYLRANAERMGIDADGFAKTDIHIHVPAGAVPKDGPSAGVTMLTSLASLLCGRSVRHDTAMTGEATLRGRVLPVGGIKEKVLAAHRLGFSRIVLPKRNEPDLDDVPERIRDEVDFVLVDDMQDVLVQTLTSAEAELDASPLPSTRTPAEGSFGGAL